MKIVGVLFLLFSGIGSASLLVRAEQKALECTRALLGVLSITRDGIAIWSMSVSEIFEKCGKELICGCGYPWDRELPESFADMYMQSYIPDGESREHFGRFASEFGKSYREQELKKTEQCIQSLQARAQSMERRLPQKKKMIYGVCLSLSSVLLILLL